MTPEHVAHLIADGESFTVEFKGEQRSPLSDADLVDSVVCLANGEGGVLLIGVEDDGRITGARPRHEAGHTDPLRVQALIANRTRPSMSVRCSVVPMPDADILLIEVDEALTPVGTAEGKYVRRALVGRGEPGCLPFHFYEMQSRQASHGALDYSALNVPGAIWDDLDPLEFERFRRVIREGGGRGDPALLNLSDLELAKSLGVVEANHQVRSVRVGALLLFGREDAIRRNLPTHEVAFQVLAQTRVEVNDFFRWPLPRLMEELLGRFRARNREQEILLGMVRMGVPDYSEVGFREAVANALVHRDYQQLGAVHVQWQPESLEISNPGGFPDGVRQDNLLVTAPRPRNPLLADAFKRAGLVERTGRGVDAIFEGQLRYGRPAPDYGRSTREQVTVVLRGGDANLALARFVAQQDRVGPLLTLDDLLVLNRAHELRQVTIEDTARLIQKPEPSARGLLNRLVERGLLEPRGAGHQRVYHLSAAVYRALGAEAGYVRTRGLESFRQEQMVLQYAQTYGTVTRRNVMDLTGLNPDQSKRLLARLLAAGSLEAVGRGPRTAYRSTTTPHSSVTDRAESAKNRARPKSTRTVPDIPPDSAR